MTYILLAAIVIGLAAACLVAFVRTPDFDLRFDCPPGRDPFTGKPR